jgi:acetyl-CoA/propionyl-CoA carboxylase biotin carboxyl carrier protein
MLETRGRTTQVMVRGLPATGAEVASGEPSTGSPADGSTPAGAVPRAGRSPVPGRPGNAVEDPAAPHPARPGDPVEDPVAPVPARLVRLDDEVLVILDGVSRRYACASGGRTVWLGRDGHAWAITPHVAGDPGDGAGAGGPGDGVVRSPMPGTVLLVKVVPGERVTEGQPLMIVEAMKMEHTVTAPADGVVAELPARAGRPVEMDAVLAVVRPAEES